MIHSAGVIVPSLETWAPYHPQVALAVANGIPLRPNLRPLSVELQNSQIGQPQPVSFGEVISQYSIFAGLGITIDPTNNLPGNPLKYISDGFEPLTSGITVSLLVKSNDGTDYAPIPDETPLQLLPSAFAPSIGIWRMVNPENVKAKFTLQSEQESDHFTVWLNFTFLVLASSGADFFNRSPEAARRELARMGILRHGAPPPATPPAGG
jgi:hypothetical protein